jgi:hypothetical protein
MAMDYKMLIKELDSKNEQNKILQKNSIEKFALFKSKLHQCFEALKKDAAHANDFYLKENGAYELELKFGSEILIFSLHTDIFNFDDNHFTQKLDYVKEDSSRSYVSIIKIYNFLADSFIYNRNQDVGYLIARIFINKENHFFVEGKRQLGFLYNDFENAIIDENTINEIIMSAILYALEFDLLVPPFDSIKEITVYQKIEQLGNAALKTGKRMGFKFQADSDFIL